MKKYGLLVLALLVMFAGAAYADYYVWEDEADVSHIANQPPPQNEKNKNIRIYKTEDATAPEKSAEGAKPSPSITLYTKNDCPECDKAREFLTSKNLTFTEVNSDIDRTAIEKRKAIDDSDDVPFAIIDRMQIYGFSETTYNRALKASR